MSDFMQKQIEASERLYHMMLADHKQRFERIAEVYDLSENLQKKLNERDEEIRSLKQKIQTFEAIERM
jgi:ABC-type enterochelin transport system substrate-binding protein